MLSVYWLCTIPVVYYWGIKLHVIKSHLHSSPECESLLQDFDPLHQPEPPRQPQGTSQSQTQFPPQEPVSIEITGASFKDDSNFCQLPPRPFQTSNPSPPVIGFEDDFNPVLPITTPSPSLSDPGAVSASPDLRHCTSDSNLLKLGKRYQTRSCDKMDPLVTRSEEDLTSVDVQGHGNRHCIAMSRDPEASPLEGSGSDFCLIDVGSVSPDVDVGRPLDRGDDADTDGRSGQTRRDHPINKHLAKVHVRMHMYCSTRYMCPHLCLRACTLVHVLVQAKLAAPMSYVCVYLQCLDLHIAVFPIPLPVMI